MVRASAPIAATLQAGLESMDMSSVVRPTATPMELVNRRFFIAEMTGNSSANKLKIGDQVLVCSADRESYFVLRRNVAAVSKSRCRVIMEVAIEQGINSLGLEGIRFDFDAVLRLACREAIFDRSKAEEYVALGVHSDACSVLSEVARLRLDPGAFDLSPKSPLIQSSVAAGPLSEGERDTLQSRWPAWLSIQLDRASDKSNANWIRHGFSLSDSTDPAQYVFKKKGDSVFVVVDPIKSNQLPQFNTEHLVSVFIEKSQAYAAEQRSATGIENLNQLITNWARELTSRIGKVPGMR